MRKIAIFEPFPVGRLDKDTEGFLLLTNDGKLAHNLLSPKKGVPKTYYAHIEGIVTEEDVERFAEGVILDDGYLTKPGKLRILKSADISEIELTITEGKFHQVKRILKQSEESRLFKTFINGTACRWMKVFRLGLSGIDGRGIGATDADFREIKRAEPLKKDSAL